MNFGVKPITINLNKEYRQSLSALKKIVNVQNDIMNYDNKNLVVDLSSTEFISPAYLPVIASLPLIKQNRIVLKYNKNSKLHQILEKQGVIEYYKKNNYVKGNENKVIPFTKIVSQDDLVNVINKILDLAPIVMSEDARCVLFSKFYEMFINATTHGANEIGAFCSGKWDFNRQSLIISVYDYGIGITKNVNNYLKKYNKINTDLNCREAFDWALTKGNSTKETDFPRGTGLNVLEDFVNKNGGKITLCSGNGIYVLENGTKKFENMENSILGTLMIINIRADNEHIYVV